MQRIWIIAAVAALSLPVVTSCAGENEAGVGLIVEVVDSETLEPRGYDATVTVATENGVEEITNGRTRFAADDPDPRYMAVAIGIHGPVRVTVAHPDYDSWERKVTIPRGDDSRMDGSPQPSTVRLKALLVPKE